VLVSIVICSNNSAVTLDGAVYSALLQDFPSDEYEVILVDDGSTDATVELASAYGKKHHNFRYVRLPLSIGKSAACEQGMQTARGKYSTSLGPDDAIHPRMLAECVQPLEKGLTDITYCDYHEVALADGQHKCIRLDCFDPIGIIGRATMLRLDLFRSVAGTFDVEGFDQEAYQKYILASEWQPYRIAQPLYYGCRQTSENLAIESPALPILAVSEKLIPTKAVDISRPYPGRILSA